MEMLHYSKQAYKEIIQLALETGYQFKSFFEKPKGNNRNIYLRHDIDYSPTMALELARINNDLGIRSTFCLLLRSQIYNAMSNYCQECLQEIDNLKQYIILHYALPATIPENENELSEMILADYNILKGCFPFLLPAFSWHNADFETIEKFGGTGFSAKGLLNVYNFEFVEDMPYYSDTNMRYSIPEFKSIIKHSFKKNLHLLLHPIYWIVGGSEVIEVLSKMWKYVIRDREREIIMNRVYCEYFHNGIPESLLDKFSLSLRQQAKLEGRK